MIEPTNGKQPRRRRGSWRRGIAALAISASLVAPGLGSTSPQGLDCIMSVCPDETLERVYQLYERLCQQVGCDMPTMSVTVPGGQH